MLAVHAGYEYSGQCKDHSAIDTAQCESYAVSNVEGDGYGFASHVSRL